MKDQLCVIGIPNMAWMRVQRRVCSFKWYIGYRVNNHWYFLNTGFARIKPKSFGFRLGKVLNVKVATQNKAFSQIKFIFE